MKRAFNLIELLMTLVIIAILLGIAIPSVRYYVLENRAMVNIDKLAAAINDARNEAIKRTEMITLCPSSDHKTCGGHWRDGQIMKMGSGQVLRIFDNLSGDDDLVWNSSGGRDESLELMPSGYTHGQRGSFYYCTQDAQHSRALVLLNTGRSYTSVVSTANFLKFCSQSSLL